MIFVSSIIHQDLGRTYYKVTVSKKSEQSIIKSSKTKLNTIQLYYQEMLANMNF